MDKQEKEALRDTSALSSEYTNLMLFRLLEILYDSKGKGAKFRTCILGKEDLVQLYGDEGLQFSTESWEENRDTCRNFLKKLGIITDLTCDVNNIEAEIRVQSCIHFPMEDRLLQEEVPPYTCIPANLFSLGMEMATGKETEIAKIEPGRDSCKIKMLFFQGEK